MTNGWRTNVPALSISVMCSVPTSRLFTAPVLPLIEITPVAGLSKTPGVRPSGFGPIPVRMPSACVRKSMRSRTVVPAEIASVASGTMLVPFCAPVSRICCPGVNMAVPLPGSSGSSISVSRLVDSSTLVPVGGTLAPATTESPLADVPNSCETEPRVAVSPSEFRLPANRTFLVASVIESVPSGMLNSASVP